jgi:hypothetical protein
MMLHGLANVKTNLSPNLLPRIRLHGVKPPLSLRLCRWFWIKPNAHLHMLTAQLKHIHNISRKFFFASVFFQIRSQVHQNGILKDKLVLRQVFLQRISNFFCRYHSGYRVTFPRVRRPGCIFNYPPSSNAEFKERLEVYLYSPSEPSWRVIG